jgi:hypothetical protein
MIGRHSGAFWPHDEQPRSNSQVLVNAVTGQVEFLASRLRLEGQETLALK